MLCSNTLQPPPSEFILLKSLWLKSNWKFLEGSFPLLHIKPVGQSVVWGHLSLSLKIVTQSLSHSLTCQQTIYSLSGPFSLETER